MLKRLLALLLCLSLLTLAACSGRDDDPDPVDVDLEDGQVEMAGEETPFLIGELSPGEQVVYGPFDIADGEMYGIQVESWEGNAELLIAIGPDLESLVDQHLISSAPDGFAATAMGGGEYRVYFINMSDEILSDVLGSLYFGISEWPVS